MTPNAPQPPPSTSAPRRSPAAPATVLRGKSGRFARVLLYFLLGGVFVAYLLPLVWMLGTSLKPIEQALAPSLRVLPNIVAAEEQRPLSALEPRFWAGVGEQAAQNYRAVWNSPVADFPRYLRNSLIVATLSVVGMTLSSAVVAYGFSRLRWRGRDAVFAVVLATLMVPFAALMAPTYLVFRAWGWIGTLLPLWLPAWFGGAFSIFLLRQFFLTIPRELDEAAVLDGCSHFGIFRRIILPLSKPALIVVALLQFVGSWNDFLGPLIFLNHQETFTLQLGLQMYQSQHGGTPWNLVMAAAVLVVLPVVLLFLFAQRAFVEGVATQGDKE